jgi:hypothetical protein
MSIPPPDARLADLVKIQQLSIGADNCADRTEPVPQTASQGDQSEEVADGSYQKQNGNGARVGVPQPSGTTRSKTATLVSRSAAEIAPERVEWIWPDRIARGKHTCIAGEPGTGKSQLTIDTPG